MIILYKIFAIIMNLFLLLGVKDGEKDSKDVLYALFFMRLFCLLNLIYLISVR